ncbi:hypothetical protein LXL04_012497 [Taraxacum kok-saghyz]
MSMSVNFVPLPSIVPQIKHALQFNFVLSCSSSQSSPFTTKTSGSSHQHSFTVTYLINSCGISPESAILASNRLDLSKSPNTADPVTDIAAIVTARPKEILTKKLQDTAVPCFNYLKTVLSSHDKVISCIKRFPTALTYDLQIYAAENIRLLLEIGVPKLRIESIDNERDRESEIERVLPGNELSIEASRKEADGSSIEGRRQPKTLDSQFEALRTENGGQSYQRENADLKL